MKTRPIGRRTNKQGTRREATLIQIQLEAQERNRRWRDFLCARRDELEARLQQGNFWSSVMETGGEPPTQASAASGAPGAPSALVGAYGGVRELPYGPSRWGEAKYPSETGDHPETPAGRELAAGAIEKLTDDEYDAPVDAAGWWQDI